MGQAPQAPSPRSYQSGISTPVQPAADNKRKDFYEDTLKRAKMSKEKAEEDTIMEEQQQQTVQQTYTQETVQQLINIEMEKHQAPQGTPVEISQSIREANSPTLGQSIGQPTAPTVGTALISQPIDSDNSLPLTFDEMMVERLMMEIHTKNLDQEHIHANIKLLKEAMDREGKTIIQFIQAYAPHNPELTSAAQKTHEMIMALERKTCRT
jgi:hypothetical protein